MRVVSSRGSSGGAGGGGRRYGLGITASTGKSSCPPHAPFLADQFDLNYSCVSQLSAAAGSITGSGALGYPSGSLVTRASQSVASAAAAQTASSKSGQARPNARRTTLSSTG